MLGGNNTDTGVNNIQYTAEFGNGVSASIGLDDPTVWDRTAVYNLSIPGAIGANGTGSNAYAGTHSPDIVGKSGSIRPGVCSSSRLRRMRSTVPTTLLGAGAVPTAAFRNQRPPRDQVGRRGDGGVADQEYPDRRRRRHQVRCLLAKGMTKYVIATSGTSPSFAMFGGSSSAYQSVGFGATTDGVYLPGAAGTGGIALTTAWGIRGAFNHNWDPYWSRSLFGSYSSVRYDGGANDNLWLLEPPRPRAPIARLSPPATRARHCRQRAGNYTCNPDFNVSQLGVITRWTPVKNLTFTAEVAVVPPRPEDVGHLGVHGNRSEADRALPVQGSGHRPASGSRATQFLTLSVGDATTSRVAQAQGTYINTTSVLTT